MSRKRPGDPETQYFKYLNRLRSAGRTNMYGAVPYLVRAFGLDRASAFEVVCRWVDAFEAKRAEAPAAGDAEIAGPLPPRPARQPTAIVVHRPRRAKPPQNRRPVPDVRIKVSKAAAPPKPKRGRKR
jgi:hypothetical protein